jgi:hypothetical protein
VGLCIVISPGIYYLHKQKNKQEKKELKVPENGEISIDNNPHQEEKVVELESL